MTVQQMVLALFEKAGEPSDLSPYNVTAEVPAYTAGNAGWIKSVTLLNRAYMKLAAWKLPGGAVIRFREHQQVVRFTVADYTPLTAIASVSSSPANVLTYTGTPFSALPSLEGWYLSVGTEAHTIISNTSSALTFDQPWTTASASLVGATGTLFKRWFPISPPSSPAYPTGQSITATDGRRLIVPMEVVCMGSVTNGGPMYQQMPGAERTQPFYDMPSIRTFPSTWRVTEQGLEFENAPYDDTVYRMRFYCEPEQFSTTNTPVYATVDAQTPNLPTVWHDILWQIAAWLRATQDKNDVETQADEARLTKMIAGTVSEAERQWDVQDSFVFETM